MESAQAVLRAIAAPGETGERVTLIGRQVGYFAYLLLDNVAWVCNNILNLVMHADSCDAI